MSFLKQMEPFKIFMPLLRLPFLLTFILMFFAHLPSLAEQTLRSRSSITSLIKLTLTSLNESKLLPFLWC